MNIGAGRIVYQDLTRVDAAIEDGSFQSAMPNCWRPARAAKAADGTLHVFGLLSPGGVHSHESHIFAMIALAARAAACRASPCTPSSTAATRRRARPRPACALLMQACAARGQCAHRHDQRPLLRDGSRPALGARASPPTARSPRRRPALSCRRPAGRARRRLRARRERRVRQADRDRRRRAVRRWRCGGVHEFPRRPRARADRVLRGAGLRRFRQAAPTASCRASSA